MRGYRQIIGLLTLCYFFSTPAHAADTWDLINKFLNEPAVGKSESAAESESDKARLPLPSDSPSK